MRRGGYSGTSIEIQVQGICVPSLVSYRYKSMGDHESLFDVILCLPCLCRMHPEVPCSQRQNRRLPREVLRHSQGMCRPAAAVGKFTGLTTVASFIVMFRTKWCAHVEGWRCEAFLLVLTAGGVYFMFMMH